MAFECTVNNSMNGILQTSQLSEWSKENEKKKNETKLIFVVAFAQKGVENETNASKEVNTNTKGMK